MNSIFRELLHEGVLANYIDNFVILAKTKKKLKEWTICLLKIAEKFQTVKMQLQYRRNIHPRSSSQTKRSSDIKQQDQGYQRMKNSHQNKENRKLLKVCKFLSTIY